MNKSPSSVEQIEVVFRDNRKRIRGEGLLVTKTVYGPDEAAQVVARESAKGLQFVRSQLVNP